MPDPDPSALSATPRARLHPEVPGPGILRPVVLWFRQDLRLSDNPALEAAVDSGRPVLCLYVHDTTKAEGRRPLGSAAGWWLHHSLEALGADIARKGGRLILRRGPAELVVPGLVAETGATALYVNRVYGPDARRDALIFDTLGQDGLTVHVSNGGLLHDPSRLTSKQGTPFKVFTPFWRHLSQICAPGRPVAAPKHLPALPPEMPPPASEVLESWDLLPTRPDWAGGLRATWTPGEDAAQSRLEAFLESGALHAYQRSRDLPAVVGTSRLSPYLRFGEISPRQIWHTAGSLKNSPGREAYLRELGWREFTHHLLAQHPAMADAPLRREYAAFPWDTADRERAAEAFRRWRTGTTGYPIVDAGMRELWETGWMHNRLRMIVGSYLVKDLLLPWRWGERWFWDTLVDACPANNPVGWQWVAGCGADAAPFFRIFNPVTQAERFDPHADYVRRWVPELARLPDRQIHKPWETTPLELSGAGVRLDETYPAPQVDHGEARKKALDALQAIKGQSAAE